MNGEKLLEDGLQVIEMKGVGSVGFGFGGVVVDFEEDAVDAGGYGGAGEDGDELGLASGDALSLTAAGAGCRRGLDGVGGVEDDRGERARMMGRERMSTIRLL